MENFIIKLYKKYLYYGVSADEFREIRYNINNVQDEELSQLLEEEWYENILEDNLTKESKESIKKKLDFYIENEDNRFFEKKRIIQVAAILIPFLFLSAYIINKSFYSDKPNNFVVSVERGNKAVVTLPDQSKVWMNSNSTLEYKDGNNKTREVKLSGEAFFKVSKDKKRPFLVAMNNLQIEVLGTSFNAKSRQGADVIETSLVEGSIKIRSSDLSQDYYLKPNEKAIYSQSKKQLQILPTDNELETSWKDNKLKFSSERFIDVMAMLEDWYGIKIICQCPEIENDLISGSFKNEKLETTLDVLRIQYKIQYTKKGDTIIIRHNH